MQPELHAIHVFQMRYVCTCMSTATNLKECFFHFRLFQQLTFKGGGFNGEWMAMNMSPNGIAMVAGLM